MDTHPSTSKDGKDNPLHSPEQEIPPQLDITSEEFDAMQALYANPNVKLTKRKSKIIYQNMAAFEIEYNKKGLYGLSSKRNDVNLLETANTSADPEPSTSNLNKRRFLPHQMAIQTTGTKAKHKRCLLKQIDDMFGPMAILRDCMQDKRKIQVYTRSEHGIRGTISGYVISFDKHWNLLLRDVHETWKRRKYKYDENKICGAATNCHERLKQLKITVPETKVKSLNRKNVELSRNIPQLMVRGEQVVLVICKEDEEKSSNKVQATTEIIEIGETP